MAEKTELEKLKSKMYSAMTEAFNLVKPIAHWGNKQREFKNLKLLIDKFVEIDQEDAAVNALAMMRRYYQKKRSGCSDYWKTAPYTPSGMLGRWDQILADLDSTALVAAADPGVDVEDMDNPQAEDILGSIQVMFSRDFAPAVRRRLIKMLARRSRKNLVEIHDEVLGHFKPSATRPMPDIAAFQEAIKEVGEGSQYREITTEETLQLPAPEDAVEVLTKAAKMAQDIKRTSVIGNQEEVDIIANRKRLGNATPSEIHWLWCMQEKGGAWVHPLDGPMADELRNEHSRVRMDAVK